MAIVDAADDHFEESSQCWCCGTRAESDRLVHLGNHPEVTVCPRCAHSLSRWAREIEDRSRTGPMVRTRDALRAARKSVVARGWHQHRLVGRWLRAIGRHTP